jgi:hypothetical protein
MILIYSEMSFSSNKMFYLLPKENVFYLQQLSNFLVLECASMRHVKCHMIDL